MSTLYGFVISLLGAPKVTYPAVWDDHKVAEEVGRKFAQLNISELGEVYEVTSYPVITED